MSVIHSYSEAYLQEVVETQGKLFDRVSDYEPGIDVEDFIKKYMVSINVIGMSDSYNKALELLNVSNYKELYEKLLELDALYKSINTNLKECIDSYNKYADESFLTQENARYDEEKIVEGITTLKNAQTDLAIDYEYLIVTVKNEVIRDGKIDSSAIDTVEKLVEAFNNRANTTNGRLSEYEGYLKSICNLLDIVPDDSYITKTTFDRIIVTIREYVNKLATTTKELAETKIALDGANKNITVLKESIATLTIKISELEARIKYLEAANKDILEKGEKEWSFDGSIYEETIRKLTEENSKLYEENLIYKARNMELEQLYSDLNVLYEQLLEDYAKLDAEYNALYDKYLLSETDLSEAKNLITQLTEEKVVLTKSLEEMTAQYNTLKELAYNETIYIGAEPIPLTLVTVKYEEKVKSEANMSAQLLEYEERVKALNLAALEDANLLAQNKKMLFLGLIIIIILLILCIFFMSRAHYYKKNRL